MSFEKLFYKGKEVKKSSKKTLHEFWLEMPKRLKGAKTIFPISSGYGESFNIIVEHGLGVKKIKQIRVLLEIKDKGRKKTKKLK